MPIRLRGVPHGKGENKAPPHNDPSHAGAMSLVLYPHIGEESWKTMFALVRTGRRYRVVRTDDCPYGAEILCRDDVRIDLVLTKEWCVQQERQGYHPDRSDFGEE